MAKEGPPSVSRDLQELQRKLCLLLESFQSNSKEFTSRWGIFPLAPCYARVVTFIATFVVAARASAIIQTFKAVGQQGSGKKDHSQGTSKLRNISGHHQELQNTFSYAPCNANFGQSPFMATAIFQLDLKKTPIVYVAYTTLFFEKVWLICSPKKRRQPIPNLRSEFCVLLEIPHPAEMLPEPHVYSNFLVPNPKYKEAMG
ncbi:lipid droplet assembly factor 1 isoform X1 [Meriones unguiculatus]|uniref:lipid droplet assembly factor 1 isoform X1 n=1 Tax=Meriones unguiculatus TaxID=10047 RepID=UPI00293E8727|nr:lipid droplet assembly factor 1 isoform X1 [Meriones unguiculatus]